MRCCGAGTALVALSRGPTPSEEGTAALMGHTSAPPRSNSLWHLGFSSSL